MPEVGNLEWLAMDVRIAPQPPQLWQLWPISVAIDTSRAASRNARASAPLTRGARRSRTQTKRNGDSRQLVLQSVLQRSQAVAVDATLEAVLVNLGPSCLAQRLCCLRALRQHFVRQLGDAGVAPRLVRSGSALQPPHSGQHLWQLSRGSDPVSCCSQR